MAQPRRVGDYELLGSLGAGGMGQVWEARHAGLPGRRLALKQATGLGSPEDRLRFRREAELLARVHHPGVVQVHAVGEAPGGPYLVMDLIEGESLADALRRGPFPCDQAVRLIERLGHALAALHHEGIVHRDLKPQNVLLVSDGTPVLVDFGLAWAGDVQRLTHTGALLGTPAYMAPELIEDASRVDPRVDVYGLGALLFALVCGRGPFTGQGLMTILHRVLHEPPEWPAAGVPGSELPAPVRQAIEAALEKDPARRPARVEDLLALLRGHAAPARAGRGLLLALLGALTLLVSAAWLAWRPAAPPPTWAPEVASHPAPGSSQGLEAAPGAGEVPRRLLGRGWLGGMFLGTDVVVWNGEQVRAIGRGSSVDGWRVRLRGPLELALAMPDGALVWTESQPAGTRLVLVRAGEEVWSQDLAGRRVTGLASWPDGGCLALAAEGQEGPLSLARGQLLVLGTGEGLERAQADVPRPLPGRNLGPIVAVGGQLLLLRATSVGQINRVIPWSRVVDPSGDVELQAGEMRQVTLDRQLRAACAGRGRAWVGDDDGRIYGLEVPRRVSAQEEELLQVHSPDLSPQAGAHPPGFEVAELRCPAGVQLWSLAYPLSGPGELRGWDVQAAEPAPVGGLLGVPTAAAFDLDSSGAQLLLVLPGDGVWLVPAALLRDRARDWSELRARGRD